MCGSFAAAPVLNRGGPLRWNEIGLGRVEQAPDADPDEGPEADQGDNDRDARPVRAPARAGRHEGSVDDLVSLERFVHGVLHHWKPATPPAGLGLGPELVLAGRGGENGNVLRRLASFRLHGAKLIQDHGHGRARKRDLRVAGGRSLGGVHLHVRIP